MTMDIEKIDNALIQPLEPKKGMRYHIANRFVDIPWGFASKTPLAGKIIFGIISMIDYGKDYSNQPLRFNIDQLADAIGISKRGNERLELFYETLKTLRKEEIDIDIEGFVLSEDDKEVPVTIKGSCSWISEFVLNSYTREAYVRLPDMLRPIVLNLKTVALKGSIQKTFDTLAQFRSQYFIHLYLLIVEKAEYASSVGSYWKPELDNLYELLCLPRSYRTWARLKDRVLDVFVQDVANNDAIDFNVEYAPVYISKGFGKGRRAVTAVKIWTIPKPKKLETNKEKVETSKKEHDVHDETGEAATDKYTPASVESTETAETIVDAEVVSEAKQMLLKHGVFESTADRLVNDYPDELIIEQIREFESRDVLKVDDNEAGYLIKKIENAFKQNTIVNNSKNEMFDKIINSVGSSSTDFAAIMRANAEKAEKAKQAEAEREAARQAELDRQAAEQEKVRQAAEARDKAINDIIGSMTDEQKVAVVEKAKEQAPEFQRKMLEGKSFDELLSSSAHAALIKQTIEEFGVQQSIF